jgi:hypothetical protein
MKIETDQFFKGVLLLVLIIWGTDSYVSIQQRRGNGMGRQLSSSGTTVLEPI